MTPTLVAALAAFGATALIIALLALHDPKRVRTVARATGVRGRTFGTPVRTLLAIASLAPGAVLVSLGQWAAFLIWIGVSCAFGWLLTVVLAPPPGRPSPIRMQRSSSSRSSC